MCTGGTIQLGVPPASVNSNSGGPFTYSWNGLNLSDTAVAEPYAYLENEPNGLYGYSLTVFDSGTALIPGITFGFVCLYTLNGICSSSTRTQGYQN